MYFSVKKIAYLGALIGLTLLLNIFTITTGVQYFAISFTYVSTFVAGFFFGPFSGALVGVLGDVLGHVIAPKGAYIPLITVSSAFLGIVPGIIRIVVDRCFPSLKEKKWFFMVFIAVGYIFILFFVTCGLNTLGLWLTYAKGKKSFWVYLAVRFPWQVVVVCINYAITLALYPVMLKILKDIVPEFAPIKKPLPVDDTDLTTTDDQEQTDNIDHSLNDQKNEE